MDSPYNDLLIDTTGPQGLVVARNGRPREFRSLRNELRGNDYHTVRGLLEEVRTRRCPISAAGTSEPSAYSAIPIIGPDNSLTGVRVLFGRDLPAETPPVAAFYWDLQTSTGVPQLHVTSEVLDLLDVPIDFRDRSVYGPLDFFGRIVHTPALIRTWEEVASAAEDTAAVGQVVVRTDSNRLVNLQYSLTWVATDVGPGSGGCAGTSPTTPARTIGNWTCSTPICERRS
ncbi:hypothetical protein NONO_c62460 [Nocardia nova SH22a]|uniref:Rv3651-like N-terminal domain-containing protein n=1 Tax=Nocardia nova SH22a TaxID=1415166 RepID=W5TV16_9NOCA|nr:GAF domain-containing protein [Nocardia nova]AHH21016.1 hypothetical protein NONO_c62460 [Nocardia nova SH22a]